jgi:predicted acylesterase/phospholipase RssA
MTQQVDAAPSALKECDLVMKGGVTSGVVYPYAVLALAESYRFRSIGGASAGAIAAAFAAAAEFARQRGDTEGFARFKSRCDEIPERLGGLFQANGVFKPLFAAALALVGDARPAAKALGVAGALWRPLAQGAAAGALLYALLALVPLLSQPGWATVALALVGLCASAVVGAVLSLVLWLVRRVARDLPKADFGLCSGLADPGQTAPVLTEWLHQSLQFIAFGPGEHPPLTFGDLRKVGLKAAQLKAGEVAIDLKMMTTNLSIGRPHVLPNFDLDLFYQPDEWGRLFPAAIVEHMAGVTIGAEPGGGRRRLPGADDLPVLVGVRMSLSFPILFRAVPLHMLDRSLVAEGVEGASTSWRRLLFSDGGITSNFPIHFFDSLLPLRPTFALSLDKRPADAGEAPRVRMPANTSQGAFSPIKDIASLGAFAGSILGAAKDWQDELQSTMPGQRSRVVRVQLDANEGGLNLNMPEERSRRLMGYGREAGELMKSFDFDRHRYARTLVAYPALERLMREFDAEWRILGPWFSSYKNKAGDYKDVRAPALAKIRSRLDALAAFTATFSPGLTRSTRFPRKPGRLRIRPILDRAEET